MNKTTFREMVAEKIIILDGAFGTELQKRGMPTGVCPEQWVLEHPDSIVAIQKIMLRLVRMLFIHVLLVEIE